MRSLVGHGPAMAWLRMCAVICASTRSAAARIAVLAERRQVALGEEVLDGAGDLVVDVDLALPQPCDQSLRRQVDEFDLVGQFQHLVGNRLADPHAGDARHDVVEALEMLDVQRRVDVDGLEQVLDVLPALGVPALREVAVGELVDQNQAPGGGRGWRRRPSP